MDLTTGKITIFAEEGALALRWSATKIYVSTTETVSGAKTRERPKNVKNANIKAVEDMPITKNKYESAKSRITRRLKGAGITEFEIKCGYSYCVGEYACVIVNGKKYIAKDIRPTEFDMEVEKMIFNVIKDYNRGCSHELTSGRRSRKE